MITCKSLRLVNCAIFLLIIVFVSAISVEAKTKIRLATDEQKKNYFELTQKLEKEAVNIQKLKHHDGSSDLPSVNKHDDLSDEERKKILKEVKDSIKAIEIEISKSGKGLFSDHVKILKSKIAFYKKALQEIEDTENSRSK